MALKQNIYSQKSKGGKKGNMKQYFNIFKWQLAHSTGFLSIWISKNKLIIFTFSLPQTTPCYRIIWFQHVFQKKKKKIYCTFIVRCENSLKIWREDVRLYSWRENKHGWLSHWQQWLLGALAAVDKVTGYQSGLKAVLFLSLCAYIMLCWAHHGNIETGNRITCWFKRGQWPSDFWSGNL